MKKKELAGRACEISATENPMTDSTAKYPGRRGSTRLQSEEKTKVPRSAIEIPRASRINPG